MNTLYSFFNLIIGPNPPCCAFKVRHPSSIFNAILGTGMEIMSWANEPCNSRYQGRGRVFFSLRRIFYLDFVSSCPEYITFKGGVIKAGSQSHKKQYIFKELAIIWSKGNFSKWDIKWKKLKCKNRARTIPRKFNISRGTFLLKIIIPSVCVELGRSVKNAKCSSEGGQIPVWGFHTKLPRASFPLSLKTLGFIK